jgi:plasmid stabilization system protein ParE
MPRGDKSKYTDKQKRKAERIEKGYKKRGISKDEAERRAWATVNKSSGGGKKSGSGRGKRKTRAPQRKAVARAVKPPVAKRARAPMATAKQQAAARRNIKKAAAAAKKKKTISHLPKKTRTALGKEGAKAAARKR